MKESISFQQAIRISARINHRIEELIRGPVEVFPLLQAQKAIFEPGLEM